MIKVKDGYAKLIGVSALGAANQVLLSNGGNLPIGNTEGNIPLNNGTVNTNLNADLLDGKHNGELTAVTLTRVSGGTLNANNLSNTNYLLKFYSGIASDSTNIPTYTGYLNALLEIPLHHNGVTAQLYFSATKALFYRSMASDTWNQIAYTTSDISGNANTASKLQNKVKIWGLDFDGSSDINGTIYGCTAIRDVNSNWIVGKDGNDDGIVALGSSVRIQPVAIQNSKGSIYLNSSGNVGIGTETPNYKLEVTGTVKASRFMSTNIMIECDSTGASGGCGSEINNYNSHLYLQHHSTNNTYLSTGGGNVGIGVTTAYTKLHVNGSILNSGTIVSDNYHLVYNCGSYSNATSSVTGAIVIKLPITSSQWDMVNVEISVYEYNSYAASKIIVGGHPWKEKWFQHSCSIIGAYDKGVRLGIYDGSWCIILGTSSTVWSYPGVFVTHIGTVYDTYSSSYLSKCSLSMVTNESSFSALVTPTNVLKATSANISTYLRTQYENSTTDWYDTYLFYTKWATRGSGSVLDLKCDGYQVRSDIAKILNTSRNIYGNNFDGSADIGSNAVGSMKYLLFRNLANDGHAGYIGRGSSSSNNLEFNNYTSNGKIILATGNRSNDLELNASGNLGIGVSPSFKFDVRSASSTASYDLHYYNSSTKAALFVGSDCFWYGNAKTSASIIFNVLAGTTSDGSGGSSVFLIYGNGNVKASNFVGNLSGKASTANMISHSTYYYSANVMKNTTSSGSIFGLTATENYLFPSFMEAHPKWNGYADVINFTGYCKWGGTQFATEYNAINPRAAIRKFNQSRDDWGDWTEFITEKNNYKVRDSGNSNEITFHYSAGGFSSTPSWLAAWNGYDITYVAPSVLNVKYATNSTYLYASDSPYRYGDSSPYYMRMRYNVNSDNRWYLSVYPETPKTVAVDYSYSSGNADTLDGYHADSFIFNRYYSSLSALPSGSTGWYKIATINDTSGSPCIFMVRAYAHSSAIFTISKGYSTSGNITQLQYCNSINGSYCCIKGARLLSDGTVEILLNKPAQNGNGYVSIHISMYNPNNVKLNSTLTLDSGSPTVIQSMTFIDASMQAAHFYESSDINLKTNIKSINSSDNIPLLKEFNWKSDGSHSYGLIALELEQMGYPELVSGEDGSKTVKYSAALSLIVGKLQVKIKELEKEIEILKNKN